MRTSPEVLPSEQLPAERVATPTIWRRVLEWVLGIAGAIGVFVGAFIQFAAEDEYLGILWIWSWRVGDISEAWKFGFLIGGSLALMAAFGLVTERSMRTEKRPTPATRVWLVLTILSLVAAIVFALLWLF